MSTSGNPVLGARVQIWTQRRNDDGLVVAQALVPGGGDVLSDADGRFQAAARRGLEAEYSIRVFHDDYLPGLGIWLRPDAAVVNVPELVLRRLRTVRGRVIDRQLHPIAGVRVFQSGDGLEWTETRSGDDGRFTLSGVAEGAAFIFAERDSYRFTGQLAAPSGPTEIVLARRDQPDDPELASGEPLLARNEELALARRVVQPFVDQALASGKRNERYWALVDWARLDPGDALARVDRGIIPDLTEADKDALRTWAAKALSYDDFDEAAAVVESFDNIYRRLEGTILLAVKAPLPRERKREILEQAALYTMQCDEPGGRALWLECAADALLDLRYDERARSLLAEAQALAATLPVAGSAGSARRHVAEVLARIDLGVTAFPLKVDRWCIRT